MYFYVKQDLSLFFYFIASFSGPFLYKIFKLEGVTCLRSSENYLNTCLFKIPVFCLGLQIVNYKMIDCFSVNEPFIFGNFDVIYVCYYLKNIKILNILTGALQNPSFSFFKGFNGLDISFKNIFCLSLNVFI